MNKVKKCVAVAIGISSVLGAVSCDDIKQVSPTISSTPEESTTPDTKPSTPVVIKFTVTFNTNNGQIDTIEVEEGNKVTKPSNPTKEGYQFLGWYEDEQLEKEYNFENAVNSNITLYAKWEKLDVYYKVTFNTNDGSKIETLSVKEGTKITKPNDPIKEGYQFLGWYEDEQLEKEYNFESAVNSNITLYAKWEQVFIVQFLLENGDIFYTTTVLKNETITKIEEPTKENYTFVGWFESISDETSFDFSSSIISDLKLYAKFVRNFENLDFTLSGYNEGASLVWKDENAQVDLVEYKKIDDSPTYTLDKELIRKLDNGLYRADIIGISEGTYTVTVKSKDNTILYKEDVIVNAHDRSGYAHFNTTGVGAYNDDGTLKENAVVVYVSEETKNTVKATIAGNEYTGLAQILKAQKDSKLPLNIRVIGKINAATWTKLKYEKTSGNLDVSQIIGLNGKKLQDYVIAENLKELNETQIIENGFNNLDTDIQNGITKLNGLTNKIKYDAKKKEFDSYYNMLDVSGASNVTLEGIGTDAMFYQFGLTWKNCSNIEVRNITFDDYTEDACSFEGSDESTTIEGFKTGHIWVHNNRFNEGKNNWDVCPEQDKLEGDGATDFKRNANITLSYNHYYKNHKTGLIGGGDTQHTANVTFHHNFYEECSSRLPLGRQANMHMYNNYYKGSTGTNMSLRGGAYAFIEACYFESVNNPIEVKESSSLPKPAAKVYGTIFDNCTGINQGVIVTSRTEVIENGNIYGSTFDTNSSIFYYDDTNNISKVKYLTDANQAKIDCMNLAGILKK